jgi:tetratricopeptide (TPR) repeat protein
MCTIFIKVNYFIKIAVGLVILSPLSVFADGLPGEYLLSDKWRQAFSYCSPIDNPSLMMEEPYLTVRGVLGFSSGNSSGLWELGAVMPLNIYNTAAITLLGESGGIVNGASFVGDSLVASGSSSNNNLFFVSSYAFNPYGKFSLGVNINIAYQGNFGDPLWGFGADFGGSYRLLNHPDFGNHLVGMTYRNLLSPQMSKSEKMPYSSQLKAQYQALLFQKKLQLEYQFIITDFASRKEFFTEGNKKLDWDMALQVGIAPLPYMKVMTFTDINQWTHLGSFGFLIGFDLPYLNNGKELAVMYQYRQNLRTDIMGINSLYGKVQFGPHREETYARHMAKLGQFALSNLYSEAMVYYSTGNYWEAYFSFSQLRVENPDFFKNDAVLFFMASCLENLDMRLAAIDMYNEIKLLFEKSPFAAQADLGLMRINYREGKLDFVENQYNQFVKNKIPDSLMMQAAYYMGETELIRGNYRKSFDFLSAVHDTHPAFVFAQHTLASVEVFLGGEKESIRQHLLNVVDAENIHSKAQREVVNRSLILLGYIYYDEDLLSKAVTALRLIPDMSYFFEDAQLGLGWSAIKARQWQDCIFVGEKLLATSNKLVIRCEAQLMQAYGYLQQKNYHKAESLLSDALTVIDSYEDTTADASLKLAIQYDRNRIIYDSLATEVVKNAKLDSWQIIKENLEKLHSEQIVIKNHIDSSLKAADDFKRTRFFERSMVQLKDDLEYALATVQKIVAKEQFDIEFKENEKSINNEIKKLKKKMEK